MSIQQKSWFFFLSSEHLLLQKNVNIWFQKRVLWISLMFRITVWTFLIVLILENKDSNRTWGMASNLHTRHWQIWEKSLFQASHKINKVVKGTMPLEPMCCCRHTGKLFGRIFCHWTHSCVVALPSPSHLSLNKDLYDDVAVEEEKEVNMGES